MNDGLEVFIQLKHSLKENKDKRIINMTEQHGDLCKFLYNLSVSINEIDQDKRVDYLKNKEFILVTNKNNKKNFNRI